MIIPNALATPIEVYIVTYLVLILITSIFLVDFWIFSIFLSSDLINFKVYLPKTGLSYFKTLCLSKGDELFNSKARRGYCDNFNLELLNFFQELVFPATRVYLTA